jgi:hypothetical protein
MLSECGIEKGDTKSGRKDRPFMSSQRNQGRLQFRLQSHIGRAAEYTRRDSLVASRLEITEQLMRAIN